MTTGDDKPLGYEQLDRYGHGVLKAISYRAWLQAMKRRDTSPRQNQSQEATEERAPVPGA